MMKKFFLSIGIVLSIAAIGQTPFVSKVWVADQGNGTYKNPVLNADYSDPDAIRVGEIFILFRPVSKMFLVCRFSILKTS